MIIGGTCLLLGHIFHKWMFIYNGPILCASLTQSADLSYTKVQDVVKNSSAEVTEVCHVPEILLARFCELDEVGMVI